MRAVKTCIQRLRPSGAIRLEDEEDADEAYARRGWKRGAILVGFVAVVALGTTAIVFEARRPHMHPELLPFGLPIPNQAGIPDWFGKDLPCANARIPLLDPMATKREGDWDYYEMTNDQDEVEFGMSGRNGFGTVTLVADADSDRLQMASRIYVSDKDVHPTLMMANAGEKRWILRDPSKGCARLEGIVYIPSTFRTFTFAVEALLHLRIAERAPGQPRLDLDKLDIEAGSVEPVFPSSTQSRRLHFSDALTAGDVRIGSFDRAELTGKLAIGGMATIGTVGDETHTDMELVFTAEGERTRSLWTFGGMGSARYDVHNEAGTHSLDVGHGNRGNLTLRYHEGQINGAFVYEERERQSIVGLGPPPVAFVGEVNKRRDRISFGIDGDEGWMDLRFK